MQCCRRVTIREYMFISLCEGAIAERTKGGGGALPQEKEQVCREVLQERLTDSIKNAS